MAALLIHPGRVPFDNGTLPLSKWYPMAPPETIMKIVSANEQINRNVNIIIYTYSQNVTPKKLLSKWYLKTIFKIDHQNGPYHYQTRTRPHTSLEQSSCAVRRASLPKSERIYNILTRCDFCVFFNPLTFTQIFNAPHNHAKLQRRQQEASFLKLHFQKRISKRPVVSNPNLRLHGRELFCPVPSLPPTLIGVSMRNTCQVKDVDFT